MNNIWQQIQHKILYFSRISKKKQYLLYIFLFFTFFVVIGYFYVQNISQYQRQKYIKQQLIEQLNHKNKIIESLQYKIQQHLLTPAIAKQLLPVNQSIKQQLLASIDLKKSHWQMAKNPLLKINLVGDFLSLRSFLFQILQINSQLKLVKCSFSKLSHHTLDTDLLINDSEESADIELLQENQKIVNQESGKIEAELLLQLQLL